MAHKGTSSFVFQRASAVLLLPLAVFFMISLVAHAGDSFVEMQTWLSAPLNSIALGGLVVIGAFHMRIGMQEVIVDYIHGVLRGVMLALNWLVALAVTALAAYSVYQLSFAG